MRRTISFLLCMIMLLTLCACGEEEPAPEVPQETELVTYAPVSFENHGKEITIREMPQKVVTAGPHCTELFCALGLSDMVVGKCMSNHSLSVPEELSDDYYTIPDLAVGYPTFEELTSSGCDFILAMDWIFGESLTVKSLEKAGITVFVLRSDSISNMYADIRTIAKIFEVGNIAEELISKDAATIGSISDVLPHGEAVRVLVLDSFIGDKVYVTGAYGYENELISYAGGANVFAELEKNWDAVSVEDIIASEPDFIIIHDYQDSDYESKLTAITEDPLLSQLDCVKNGQFLRVPLENTFPGVRCSSTVQMIAAALYPDAFHEA